MEEICKFKINDKEYTIYDVDKIEGKNSYVGQSSYEEGKIYVEKGKPCTFGYMKMVTKIKMVKKYLVMKIYVNIVH